MGTKPDVIFQEIENDIELKFSKEKGFHVIAKRDIPNGKYLVYFTGKIIQDSHLDKEFNGFKQFGEYNYQSKKRNIISVPTPIG